jgi:hypothetical protein
VIPDQEWHVPAEGLLTVSVSKFGSSRESAALLSRRGVQLVGPSNLANGNDQAPHASVSPALRNVDALDVAKRRVPGRPLGVAESVPLATTESSRFPHPVATPDVATRGTGERRLDGVNRT